MRLHGPFFAKLFLALLLRQDVKIVCAVRECSHMLTPYYSHSTKKHFRRAISVVVVVTVAPTWWSFFFIHTNLYSNQELNSTIPGPVILQTKWPIPSSDRLCHTRTHIADRVVMKNEICINILVYFCFLFEIKDCKLQMKVLCIILNTNGSEG